MQGIRRSALAALAVAAVAAGGCSISHSVKSISDSVSSPFKSSSKSSGGGKEDSAYQDEVATYTAGYATAGGDAVSFRRGIASIATKRGIDDWEEDDATCQAIGVGLRKAGLSSSQASQQAQQIAGDEAECAKQVMKGFGD